MVSTLILIQVDNGNLHDQDGHLHNAASQIVDNQGVAIPDTDVDTVTAVAQAVDEAARPDNLVGYNRPEQY